MNKDILPVLDEITAVLKKHDMVGLVVVGNPTHCDWRMEVEASWSCAWLEKDADGRHLLRVRSKAKDYPSIYCRHDSTCLLRAQVVYDFQLLEWNRRPLKCPNCGREDMQVDVIRETKPECLRRFVHCNHCGHERLKAQCSNERDKV